MVILEYTVHEWNLVILHLKKYPYQNLQRSLFCNLLTKNTRKLSKRRMFIVKNAFFVNIQTIAHQSMISAAEVIQNFEVFSLPSY